MSYKFSWHKYINFHDNKDDNHGCMTRFLPHHLFRLKQIFTTFIPHRIFIPKKKYYGVNLFIIDYINN